MSCLTLFCILATTVVYSHALDCYTCESPVGMNLPCENNPAKTGVARNCEECVVFKINYPVVEKMARKCIISSVNFCQDLRRNSTIDVSFCETCGTNLCNSSAGLGGSVLFLFLSFGLIYRLVY